MADDEFQHNRRGRQYSFGEFIFDAQKGELRRNGSRIDINQQLARLLEALLYQAPDVISRDALQDKLWGGKATVEFEQSLNSCIGLLRNALGETAKDSGTKNWLSFHRAG